MEKLKPSDLLGLEEYHRQRSDFRARVLAHKQNRQVAVGPNATLSFEDRLTMQYQVQEMLRIERIFETEGIEDELSAYNPLIPDGSNLKATFMIEFPDVEERHRRLAELVGIEDGTYVEVEGFERVYAVSNEDLERSNEDKTSAVHFMRFELEEAMKQGLRDGAALAVGIDHPKYEHRVDPVPAPVRQALLGDLD